MARLAAAAAAASLLFDRCACTASPTLALGLNTSAVVLYKSPANGFAKAASEGGREGVMARETTPL